MAATNFTHADSTNHHVITLVNDSNNSPAETTAQKVIDMSDIAVAGTTVAPARARIECIHYSVGSTADNQQGVVYLSWGIDSAVPFLVLSGNGYIDYRAYGGLGQGGAVDVDNDDVYVKINATTTSYAITLSCRVNN